jgi:uncharacterized protein DUF1778
MLKQGTETALLVARRSRQICSCYASSTSPPVPDLPHWIYHQRAIRSRIGGLPARLPRSSAKPMEPKEALGSPFLRCTIARMKKGAAPKSRRRSRERLGRKTFVYLTDEERRLVDHAAASERRSVSSFIANAAVEAAERLINRNPKKS